MDDLVNKLNEVYQTKGLFYAMDTLFFETRYYSYSTVYTMVNDFIKNIYALENLECKNYTYYEGLINNIMPQVSVISRIYDMTRATKGEMRQQDIVNLDKAQTQKGVYMSIMVNAINQDIMYTKMGAYLSVKDFIDMIFKSINQNTTSNDIYFFISNYLGHKNVILDDNNNFKSLIREIMRSNDSAFIIEKKEDLINEIENLLDQKTLKNK